MRNVVRFRKEIEEIGIEKAFKEYAEKYSECSSCVQGGDLGWFGKGEMVREFEEVAFRLKVGEMSQPVSTESGIHIIWRTG
jgi:parvulin-like peptidyl-prolyl isomerase